MGPWVSEHTEDRLRLVGDTRVLGVLRTGHDLEARRKPYQSTWISIELDYLCGQFIGVLTCRNATCTLVPR